MFIAPNILGNASGNKVILIKFVWKGPAETLSRSMSQLLWEQLRVYRQTSQSLTWYQTDNTSSLIQRWLQTGPLRLVYTLPVYFGLIWNMKPSDWHSYSGKPSTLHWITVSSHSQFFRQKCVRFVVVVGIVLVPGISLQLEWKSVCRSFCCRLKLIRQHPSASQVKICLCMESF